MWQTKYDLTVSIVLFNTNSDELENVLRLLESSNLRMKIFLVDNSETDRLRQTASKFELDYIFSHKNFGYGKGHNIAIKKAKHLANYHLVMNSDVYFDPKILDKAFNYLESNHDVSLVSPLIRLNDGELQHFCRLLPTPFDLFARRFIPDFLKSFFKKRLDEYILAKKDYFKPMNIPNLPGCFMFLRMKDLIEVNGFDENIFLYVEDIDLTRRLHEKTKTMYYPEIEIIHGLARGSYKFSKLVFYHINSAIYYFNKWGWFFDSDRSKVNHQILSEDNSTLKRQPDFIQIVR